MNSKIEPEVQSFSTPALLHTASPTIHIPLQNGTLEPTLTHYYPKFTLGFTLVLYILWVLTSV